MAVGICGSAPGGASTPPEVPEDREPPRHGRVASTGGRFAWGGASRSELGAGQRLLEGLELLLAEPGVEEAQILEPGERREEGERRLRDGGEVEVELPE